MLLLTVGSIMFNKDATKLVLEPIERMTEKVKIMVNDPLAVINGDLESKGVLAMANKQV